MRVQAMLRGVDTRSAGLVRDVGREGHGRGRPRAVSGPPIVPVGLTMSGTVARFVVTIELAKAGPPTAASLPVGGR